jgi:hypothetical protein
VRAVPRRAERPLRHAGAILACALFLAGCGGSDDDGTKTAANRPPGLPADFNIQLFDCEDWTEAKEPVRAYVLRRYRQILGGDVTGRGVAARGSVLPDAEARRLFDNYCAQRFARRFVLYKLYGEAAGFTGANPAVPTK